MMEDVKIMENMREVLKKTRKSKHKKSRCHHSSKNSEANDDAISEILNKKWMFSSPPSGQLRLAPQEPLQKLNAFQLMMSKKPEPFIQQISPEVNGVKKKRKYMKKPKYNKLEDEPDNKSEDENTDGRSIVEPAPNGLFRFLKKSEPLPEEDDSIEKIKIQAPKRKRNRANDALEDMPVNYNKEKKRKTKAEKILLDSNENSLHSPTKVILETEVETPTYLSGRPRRSCSGRVNYELLITPDKEKLPENKDTLSQRETRSKTSKKDDSFEVLVIVEESPVKKETKKKLAPVFVKKVPKPSIDPAVKEARRNFLLLGLPEDLRNSIDKQKQFEDEILSNELIAFPSISHVTQLKGEDDNGIITKCLWLKSIVKMKSNEIEYKEDSQRLLTRGALTDCCTNDVVPVLRELTQIDRDPIYDAKQIVKQMKEDFENFPTNRCYKQLSQKYQKSKVDTDSDYFSQGDCTISEENSSFVDIFKPNKFNEFLVNLKPIQELRKFLLTWDEKEDYDSENSSSWQSSKGLDNFSVLTGLNGTGKTSSIYALAKDLNYQVIEINAGSRRSGKKMLQDLSEATQSHRVKNKSGKMLSPQDENVESSQGFSYNASNGAKSIILIEDAEIVFESDEGFASSLQQLINISKRPVILTTNNRNCQHLQKFIQQNEIMYQRPKNVDHIAKYLSVLCLAANYQINAVATGRLYALNGHDLRKTINEIEFFIRSESAIAIDGNLMKFYERPRREWLQENRMSSFSNKTLSSVCFESSIMSSFAASAKKRADDHEASYQQRHLMDEMADFIAERCNVAEIQPDLAHGKQKIIER